MPRYLKGSSLWEVILSLLVMLENEPFLLPAPPVSVSASGLYSNLIIDVLERLDWLLNGVKEVAMSSVSF